MKKLLTNRTFILVLSFILGLFVSDLARYISFLTMPALALVLTVSAAQVSAREFFPLKNMVRPVILAFLLNYIVLGGIILLLAWQLMPTQDLWIGYVLVAVAPPGIAIIPFTYVLKGNVKVSLFGTFGVYLLAIPLMPVFVFLFTGEAGVSPVRLVNTLFFLILVPFIFSQMINRGPLGRHVEKWRGSIINWGFFIVIYTVVGVNQEVFLHQHSILIPVSLVAIISVTVPGLLLFYLGKKLHLHSSERNSFILLSTIKTSAFAAAVGLSLYNEATSIPGAVISAWYALYFIFLGYLGDRKKI